MKHSSKRANWGAPPWTIDFRPTPQAPQAEVDFAIVGGGFTGLAAAAWLRRLAPQKSVVVLEAGTIGAGSSGRTGGMALAESAAGELPGLGDVLGGFSQTLHELDVDCDLALPGAWELARREALPRSPISWNDSGNLRAVAEVPGGTIDPGKMLSGLARAAERQGAVICERARVEHVTFGEPLLFDVGGRQIRARAALFASNAQSLEISGMAGATEPWFVMASATKPFTPEQLAELGLGSGKPFYTVELPYLWGRLMPNNGILFGAGRMVLKNWRDIEAINVATGEPVEIYGRLQRRVRNLHPVLHEAEFTHYWGGPILVGENWRPVFRRHPQSDRALVLGAYSGHGVALSVYLGRWAAEALLERRPLPRWGGA